MPAEKNKNNRSRPDNEPGIGRLKRSDTDRVIAGIAGGLGEYFNIDSTVIRLIFVMLTVFGGGGILLYLVLWLIIPSQESGSMTTKEMIKENNEEIRSKAQTAADNIKYHNKKSGGNRGTLAIILVILGIYFLLNNLGFFRFIDLSKFWPLILIFIGILILFRND